MSEYSLPLLDDGWKWHLDTDNPAKVRLWAYRDAGPFGYFADALTKVLVAEEEAGINDPEYVSSLLYRKAESSMEWGSWSEKGQENQESLRGLLGLT